MKTNDIITERLIIRNATQDDAENLFSIWADFEGGKYLHDPYYNNPKELYDIFKDVDIWTDYSMIAFERDTNRFIGTCSLGPEKCEDEFGFGYCVIKEEWGKGYATEMVNALLSLGKKLGIKKYTATIAQENIASCKLMEKFGLRISSESSYKKKGTENVYLSYIYKMEIE